MVYRRFVKYPLLYQVNTRVWLNAISHELGRPATLDDISDAALDEFVSLGFEWVWMLSVWTTGKAGQDISRHNPEWRKEFEQTLPDLHEGDIAGSGFAITAYEVPAYLGGDDALERLRGRMNECGLKLMLDFVPNHMGPDHPWIIDHPDFFITGTEEDLRLYPQNYTRVRAKQGEHVLAYGRDPYFHGWPDTWQLDYSHPELVTAMKQILLKISKQCDGVRCDMAMVILPEVFEKTWGRKALPFWEDAIRAVHSRYPDFLFLAEVYWDLEWTLQQLGFQYTYDKDLYDRLLSGQATQVREHLSAPVEYQNKMTRFLENHDEQRAALVMDIQKHEAAAIITYLTPGLRFFHQGQLEGWKKKISPHLVRAPIEIEDLSIKAFYFGLLGLLKDDIFTNGRWLMLSPRSAWEGNPTWENFISFLWTSSSGDHGVVVIVNYASVGGQCYVTIPFEPLRELTWELFDLMSGTTYAREGNELLDKGLYLDLKPWQYHVFDCRRT